MASGVRPPTKSPSDTSTEHDESTGELVGKATRQLSELVHQELALAKAELTEKGKEAGRGAGLFGGAGTVAFYGGATLVGAAVAALAVALPVWAAALIVGVVLLAIAGLLAAAGRSRMRRATPPVPEQTAESVKTDVHEIKDHLKERHA
ncbi:phage holin family protein [Actinoallomurus soli]|uniref:phage holin family protein n=1 Tax=Actinoallomurus soli TaxID=2952535 RepID=UPI0020931B71|nr:phage holin family protein [Actinoallomurus soli]MCO5969021.1 phage holin family protein [Actinoallomurus soli]